MASEGRLAPCKGYVLCPRAAADPKAFDLKRETGYSGRVSAPASKKIEYPQLVHAA
jgi:hypothetical protein